MSYVWGDPNITHLVMVDGHPVEVTTNLDEFLLRYRKMCAVVRAGISPTGTSGPTPSA